VNDSLRWPSRCVTRNEGMIQPLTCSARTARTGISDRDHGASYEAEIEEEWEVVFETDKAWDALHRCLSNGTLNVEEGDQ
jgi:hypothetical protein